MCVPFTTAIDSTVRGALIETRWIPAMVAVTMDARRQSAGDADHPGFHARHRLRHSPHFVPVEERIALIGPDGTLWIDAILRWLDGRFPAACRLGPAKPPAAKSRRRKELTWGRRRRLCRALNKVPIGLFPQTASNPAADRRRPPRSGGTDGRRAHKRAQRHIGQRLPTRSCSEMYG